MHVELLPVKASPPLATKTKIVSRVIAILFVLPCILLAWLALQWGIADRHSYNAKQIEKQWSKNNLEVPLASLMFATASAEKAVTWAPDNALYRDQLGRSLTIKFLKDKQSDTAELARHHLMYSRSVKSDSPSNWAAYVELKYHLKEADFELSEAITKAVSSGPWEPSVLQAVSTAGVTHFEVLTEPAQTATIDNIRRGLNSSVPRMPALTVDLIQRAASGWTMPFARELIDILVDEPWMTRGRTSKAELSLMLWQLLDAHQQADLTIKIAQTLETQRNSALLRKVRKSGQLSLVCLHLPRIPKFDRPCSREFRKLTPTD